MINDGVAYSNPSPQNSAIILLSSLAKGVSYVLPFVSFINVTDSSMTIYFEMGLFGLFYGHAKITCVYRASNIIVLKCLYLEVSVHEP